MWCGVRLAPKTGRAPRGAPDAVMIFPRAGVKANRSFVVQALTRRLQKEIEGLTSERSVSGPCRSSRHPNGIAAVSFLHLQTASRVDAARLPEDDIYGCPRGSSSTHRTRKIGKRGTSSTLVRSPANRPPSVPGPRAGDSDLPGLGVCVRGILRSRALLQLKTPLHESSCSSAAAFADGKPRHRHGWRAPASTAAFGRASRASSAVTRPRRTSRAACWAPSSARRPSSASRASRSSARSHGPRCPPSPRFPPAGAARRRRGCAGSGSAA
jgi:hypothetical protein